MALVEFVNNSPPYLNADNLNNNFTECNNIIDSGSNANGSYMKFNDGTLIQRGGGQCPANVAYVEVTYPIPFIDTNYTIIANHKYTGGSGYGGSTQNNNIVVSQAWHNDAGYIYSNLPDLTVATYPRNVQYIAIGRWKS